MRPTSGIRVGHAGRKGRGVFATKHYYPGDLIERAPLISVSNTDDVPTLTGTIIERYWYEMDDGGTAIGLGYTSLYNHSSRANAVYEAASSDNTVYIVAYREIKPGKEITINYNGDPNSKAKIDFNYDRPAYDQVEDDGPDPTIHYLDEGEWGRDGWVWCGACDVRSTTEPALVTCTYCGMRMLAERTKLLEWDPESSEVTAPESLIRMLGHTIERLSRDGQTIYADIVREAVRTMKKES